MATAYDRLQRLSALRQQGVLTDAEYEAKRAVLVDEALGDDTSGRNAGHVVLGALGGFVLGLVFVGALLAFVPKEKRADRLFGAWLGTVLGAIAAAVLVAALSVASGSADDGATVPPQPLFTQPTAISSLLTQEEACQVAKDFAFTSNERAHWIRCHETRYRSEDRTWVVTIEFAENQGDVTPVDTNIMLIDDRCGRPVGNKACQ